MILKKTFFKLMKNVVFGETMVFVRKHRDIELVKTEILIDKPVHLALSILELSKILMYEFWCDYLKPKYGEKAKLCYMDTDSFLVYIKRWYLQRYCRRC